jgi:hypothetical protein
MSVPGAKGLNPNAPDFNQGAGMYGQRDGAGLDMGSDNCNTALNLACF